MPYADEDENEAKEEEKEKKKRKKKVLVCRSGYVVTKLLTDMQ